MRMGCPTSKHCYDSRREARKVRTRLPNRKLSAYRCRLCGFWHLGNLPAAAVRTSRSQLFDGFVPEPRPLPVLRAAPVVELEQLTHEISAHVAFSTRLCGVHLCPHELPCPRHPEEKAA